VSGKNGTGKTCTNGKVCKNGTFSVLWFGTGSLRLGLGGFDL